MAREEVQVVASTRTQERKRENKKERKYESKTKNQAKCDWCAKKGHEESHKK